MCNIAVAPLVGAWIEIIRHLTICYTAYVAPLVGAWIEIVADNAIDLLSNVAPLVGAWIEMFLIARSMRLTPSLLSWERGLKYCWPCYFGLKARVAPLVGAWIEIKKDMERLSQEIVAPLVGAWIEISHAVCVLQWLLSLLSWERGLKSVQRYRLNPAHRSLLSWERGLKCHSITFNIITPKMSLLSWERGLK